MKGNIIPYMEMCHKEGASLQKCMNFRLTVLGERPRLNNYSSLTNRALQTDKTWSVPYYRSLWLFHTNRGQPYIKEDGTANGFDSIWQRFMAKALQNTALEMKFTEHDLRAKVASDTGIEHARSLLGHSNAEITERIYRRRPEMIKPAS